MTQHLVMSRTIEQKKNGDGFPKAGELIEFPVAEGADPTGQANPEPACRTRGTEYRDRRGAPDSYDSPARYAQGRGAGAR